MFPGYESMNGDTARAQFSAGNIGMIGVMSSDVTTFKNQFPCDFEWTMIPYPWRMPNITTRSLLVFPCPTSLVNRQGLQRQGGTVPELPLQR